MASQPAPPTPVPPLAEPAHPASPDPRAPNPGLPSPGQPSPPSPVRTLVAIPADWRRGEAFEVRTTLGHPMETGLRTDSYGVALPRNLVTRFEASLDGALVFAADLYPAIATNPYISFWVRADGPATLTLEWTGDRGFRHRETRTLQPA